MANTCIEESLDGSGGLKIFTRTWRPEGKPRGVIVLVHGFNSHSGYYLWAAEQLVASGLAVHAFDLRGRGKSDGERYYVEKFAEYQADVDLIVNRARSQDPDCPCSCSATAPVASSPVTTYSITRPCFAGLVCESFAYQVPAPDFALSVLKGLSHLAPHAHVLKLKKERLLARSQGDPGAARRPAARE
jgi:hypothetical protein